MSKAKAAIPQPYLGRIEGLRAEIKKRKLDGYLVLDRMDQYWLTGFTGEDGQVLVTPKAVVLLTDGRFDEAADIQAPYAKKVLRKQRSPETNAKEILRHKVEKLGFDPGQMTVSDHDALKKLVKPTKLVPSSGVFRDMRACKDAGEVEVIRKAIYVAEEAYRRWKNWLKPGVTEREAAARIEYEMQMLGAQGPSFPSIVAFGPNGSLPHYEPGDRKLEAGEPVLIDWGARVEWYCSDLTRVIWADKTPPRLAEIHRVVQDAHGAAIAAARPGMTGHELDKVARDIIKKAGYGDRFNHALGHGMGLDVHEAPRLGMKTEMVIRAGMVVTIEPGIYFPGVGGVRIEDDILITDSGSEVLTTLEVEQP